MILRLPHVQVGVKADYIVEIREPLRPTYWISKLIRIGQRNVAVSNLEYRVYISSFRCQFKH